jgi:hypothetical protein
MGANWGAIIGPQGAASGRLKPRNYACDLPSSHQMLLMAHVSRWLAGEALDGFVREF